MTYFSVNDVGKDVRLECLMKCSMYVRDKEDVMCKEKLKNLKKCCFVILLGIAAIVLYCMILHGIERMI